MVTIIPDGTPMICAHPFQFFFVFFFLTIALGFWLGRQWNHWQVRRLQDRNDTLKMELAMSSPRRPNWL